MSEPRLTLIGNKFDTTKLPKLEIDESTTSIAGTLRIWMNACVRTAQTSNWALKPLLAAIFTVLEANEYTRGQVSFLEETLTSYSFLMFRQRVLAQFMRSNEVASILGAMGQLKQYCNANTALSRAIKVASGFLEHEVQDGTSSIQPWQVWSTVLQQTHPKQLNAGLDHKIQFIQTTWQDPPTHADICRSCREVQEIPSRIRRQQAARGVGAHPRAGPRAMTSHCLTAERGS